MANLTRADAVAFFAHPAIASIRTHVERFPLVAADDALQRLRDGTIVGAAVLIP